VDASPGLSSSATSSPLRWRFETWAHEGLDYLDLLAEVKPEKLEQASLRWHGRLELEASTMTLGESQLALAALASLCAGEREAIGLLRKLLRRVRPTLLSRVR